MAVLPLKGNIHHDTIGKGEGKTDGISYYSIKEALKELKKESSVKAVILEVDSPGGSAFVSELLYQEILKLQKRNLYMRIYKTFLQAEDIIFLVELLKFTLPPMEL